MVRSSVEAIIFTGIQATGKSTFYIERFFHTHVRISLDLVRTRHRERVLLATCLRLQQRFVVDNTNPAAADRARYIAPARAADFRVTGYYFQSIMRDALARNTQRPLDLRIPDNGVRGAGGRLELPRLGEGYDELWYVRIDPEHGFVVEPWREEAP